MLRMNIDRNRSAEFVGDHLCNQRDPGPAADQQHCVQLVSADPGALERPPHRLDAGRENRTNHLLELAAGESPQRLLRLFEKRLLEAVGFGLQLDREAGSGQPLLAEALYRYVPDSGPVRLQAEPDDPGRRVSGRALLALQSGEVGPEHLRELKSLMRMLIRHYLGDRELKSLSLYLES